MNRTDLLNYDLSRLALFGENRNLLYATTVAILLQYKVNLAWYGFNTKHFFNYICDGAISFLIYHDELYQTVSLRERRTVNNFKWIYCVSGIIEAFAMSKRFKTNKNLCRRNA